MSNNAERVLEKIVELARAHPGQPVAVVSYPDGEVVGVMNIFPVHDDWFYYPVPLEEIVQAEETQESIA